MEKEKMREGKRVEEIEGERKPTEDGREEERQKIHLEHQKVLEQKRHSVIKNNHTFHLQTGKLGSQ